jgi:hypothetical protein
MAGSCLKYLLQQRIFVPFVFFVVKKWAVMMAFDADFDAYFVRKNDKKRAV